MRYIFGIILLVAANSVSAVDAPTIGTVHNTKDNGWISYECGEIDNGLLTCALTQVMVRKKINQSEIEAKYRDSIKDIENQQNDPSMKDLCALAAGTISLLQGGSGDGLEPEIKKAFQGFNSMQRRDIEEQSTAVLETCRTKNMDGLRRFLRLAIEKDARTCLVSTYRFEQTFHPVTDYEGKLTSWTVANAQPQGDCGFVQMSRFVPDDNKPLLGKIILWKYIAKRATSNPEGKTFMDTSCSGWDETETVYSWQSKEIPLQCDYIEYSPF